MMKFVKKLFSKNALLFLGSVYLSTFFIDVVRRNTSLGDYEESVREKFNADGSFLQNMF